MDKLSDTIGRRPSGVEPDGSILCSVLQRSMTLYPALRRCLKVCKIKEGSLGLLVQHPRDTSGTKPVALFEIHLDEVSLHLGSYQKPQSATIGAPVWSADIVGNLKYHIWGEKMVLYSVYGGQRERLGVAFVMQNPPHCDDINNNGSKQESVLLRLEHSALHKQLLSHTNKKRRVVAVFHSSVSCNRDYCIGPGIDNSVSWYGMCEVIQKLYKRKSSCVFTPFLLQLSAMEEMGESRATFSASDLASVECFFCLDTELAEVSAVDPKCGCVAWSKQANPLLDWVLQQPGTQPMDPSAQVGGTNLDLYSDSIPVSMQIGIPIIGMHSAHEQISTKTIRSYQKLLTRICKKLKQLPLSE